MIARLRRAFRKAPILSVALTIALGLTLFFGVRLTTAAIYWADPNHIDQPIAGWMTPGYVSMSWQVPRENMFNALALTPGSGRPPRLEDLAAERDIPLPQLIDQIEAIITEFRAAQP